MNIHWLMRMKRWVQNPPSEKRVKLVFGVIVACLVLFAVERFIGWPDWMTADTVRAPRVK